MRIVAIQDEQMAIGQVHITFRFLTKSNEMKYPLVKQYGCHPSS
jgi:hypothetical protein